MDPIILILFGIQLAIPLSIIIAHTFERRASLLREQSLLAALVSKSAHEYALSLEALKRSPKDKIREMEVENELAEHAAALEGVQVPGSYPVM